MNRLFLIIISLVFSISSVKAQYPTQGSQVVTNINNLQRGWIVIGSSGVGLDSRWTIIDGGRYDKYDRVDVCYSIDDAANWKKISYQESGCGNCSIAPPGGTARGACYKYEKQTSRTVGGTSSPSPIPQPSPKPSEQPITAVTGTIMPLLTCEDIKNVDVYIEPINGNPNSRNFLGQYTLFKEFKYYVDRKLDYTTNPAWNKEYDYLYNKKKVLPAGSYKLIAIENSNSETVRRFEKIITINSGECTFVNIDFNYSYLYCSVILDLPYNKDRTGYILTIPSESKKIYLMAYIRVDDTGNWIPYVPNELKNVKLCGSDKIDPIILKPGTHRINVRITKILDNGEEQFVYGVFNLTVEPDKCYSKNIDIGTMIHEM